MFSTKLSVSTVSFSKSIINNCILINTSYRLAHHRTWGKGNLIRSDRFKRFAYQMKKRDHVPAFEGAPHRKGIVEQVLIKSPRKPNSGKRQCVDARIKTKYPWKKNHPGKRVLAYIPFEKYALSKWNRVLIEGFTGSDVPYVKCRCIRGKYDLPPPQNRGSSNKPSKKRLPGNKADRYRKIRTRYYKLKSSVIPDIHSYMI